VKTRILILSLAAAFAAGCNSHSAEKHEEIRPVRSLAVGATAGSVGASYPGEVRARHESKLGFRTAGKIAQRLVDVGSRVKPGQVLMRLDPEQEQLHAIAVTAQVDGARSRVTQDRIDLERTQSLFARKFASAAELDQARLALAESESKLANAVAQQKIAVNQRAYTEIVADRAGVVTAVNGEVGQVVHSGDPIVTVAADGEREVVVSIPEARIAELQAAQRMTVTLWANPHKTYLARLRELSPDTDEVTRTYAARVTIQDSDAAIHLGMTATVFTPDIEGAQAIRLPLTAVHDPDGKPRVWIVDPATSRVSARPVKLGAAQKDTILIADGLKAGDVVVTAGVNQLSPGQKVKTAGAKS
jgi:membrane fusion protein, multidrug efflux system